MTDSLTRPERSKLMSRIRGKGNASTEGRLVALLRACGVTGWRRHLPLPGRPDFTFRAPRVVVFVDGCFWHHCPQCGAMPASNRGYWKAKFERNQTNDRAVTKLLRKAGWTVVRVWEHALKQQPGRVVARIRRALAAGS